MMLIKNSFYSRTIDKWNALPITKDVYKSTEYFEECIWDYFVKEICACKIEVTNSPSKLVGLEKGF